MLWLAGHSALLLHPLLSKFGLDAGNVLAFCNSREEMDVVVLQLESPLDCVEMAAR